MITVLVTGARGQLGQCLQQISGHFLSLHFIFVDKDTLDITNNKDVLDFFDTHSIDWCINCAAYTAVDNAENNPGIAFEVNVIGANNIAQACQLYDVKLIHISTDFIFDGLKSTPYTELDDTNPINVYGGTKLKGEQEIEHTLKKYFIIRTSWLYSEHGNNFLKTMLRLAIEREELSIINDQYGTPTYAGDLAQIILLIIQTESKNYGTYHYSNEGAISWFDFAKAIFDESNIEIILQPIPTHAYPTLAKRPLYSVLNKTKIKETFNINVSLWRDSLKIALSNIKNSR